MSGERQPLSREELTEWMAFHQLEPFGSWFDEYRAALISSIIAEVNRNRKKRGRPYAPKEFLQDWEAAAQVGKPQSAESMFEFVKSMQAAMEVKAGKRSMQDLHKPVILDHRGRPIDGGTS